jgi:hypothetical protein
MGIPGREITTLRTAVHSLNSVAPYPVTSPFGSMETVISISLDRWRNIWFALIMEVLCLLGYDAVYYDNYDTRSARRLVLFSQTANMFTFLLNIPLWWYVKVQRNKPSGTFFLIFFSRDLVSFKAHLAQLGHLHVIQLCTDCLGGN